MRGICCFCFHMTSLKLTKPTMHPAIIFMFPKHWTSYLSTPFLQLEMIHCSKSLCPVMILLSIFFSCNPIQATPAFVSFPLQCQNYFWSREDGACNDIDCCSKSHCWFSICLFELFFLKHNCPSPIIENAAISFSIKVRN